VLTIAGDGQTAGLILDGGSIAASSLIFSGNEAVVYITAQNGTISSPITSGSFTKFGPGTLTLSNATPNNVVAVNVNGGTLRLSGITNAAGAVSVNNGGTLAGTGTIVTTGSNGLSFGPKATFAPGFATNGNVGTNYGILTISTDSGNVKTTSPTTNPTAMTSAGLTFGLGISPTNVVGTVFQINLGAPLVGGAANSGLSNANLLGSRASGFGFISNTGAFTLDPITTVTVNANLSN
jgi:hypothetical protein